MADDRTIRVRFLAEVGQYMDGVRRMGATTKTFGNELTGSGKTVKADIEKVGRAALVMSGGMAIALGAAAKAAMNWESAFAGVAKTVDGDLGALEEGLRDLAKQLPATHAEIAGVAEAAGQLGIAKSSILDFTETMIALGETTNMTAEEAATSIAQFMNIMQSAPGDVDNLSSALVDLGNNGASTEKDIVEMALRLAGAGRMIGANEQEIMALSSAMADLGIQAQLGGGAMSRQLRKINSAVLENGDTLQKWAAIANVSAEEFGRVWRDSPAAAMDLVAKGLGKVRDAGGDVAATLETVGVKGTQDLDVMGRLAGAGDRISKSLITSNEAWKENVALQEEAAKRYGTTESQMQIAKNKVTDLGIELGDKLLPVINAVVDGLGTFADVMGSLPGGMQTGLVALAGLATVGLGVVGIAGTLAPKVRELDRVLESMGMSADFASRNVGRFMTFAAKGTLVIGILYGVGKALDAAFDEDTSGNITETENALARLAGGASLQGLDIDVESLGRALERIVDPSIATKADHVKQNIVSLGGLLGDFDDNLKDAKDEVDGLDKALASLAQQDPDAAAAALKALEEALGPETFAQLLPLLDDYQISLTALDTAGRLGANGIEEVTNAAGVSETQIDDLSKAIDDLMSHLFGVESAQDAWQQQLNDLDDVLKQAVEDGLSLNDVLTGQSDGAIALREHLRGTAEAGAEMVTQWVAAGKSGEELQTLTAGLVEAFVNTATQLGISEEAARHYAESLYGIPTELGTNFYVTGVDGVIERLGALAGAFAQVPKVVPFNFTGPIMKGQVYAPNPDSRMGNVFAFARGGMTQAHVARDGSILKYAEKATGGEAFVPKNGDAARSMGILRTAAGWYGADVVPGGQGASLLPPPGGSSQPIVVDLSATFEVDGKQVTKVVQKQVRIEGGVARVFAQ